MNLSRYLLLVVILAGMLMSSSVKSQVIDQIWFEYQPSVKFKHNYKLGMRASYRTDFEDPRWRTIEARLMPEKKLGKYFDVLAVFQFLETWQSGAFTSLELRPAIGGRVHFTPEKRVETFLFPRFEYRFVLNQSTHEWNNSPRLRVRVGVQMPFNKPSMKEDNVFYGILDAEAFFIDDNDIQEVFMNRLWVRLSLGYKLNKTLRFEAVYNFQDSKNTVESSDINYDGIIRFIVRHNLN